MEDQFIRTRMLLGDEALEKLQASHVAIFGLGGVGSWCAEALCRSGVGELTLIDLDELSVSNINRQSFAVHSTVGMKKAEAAALRLKDISPTCQLHPMAARYEAQTRDEFFTRPYDCIVDAIDLVSCKLDLIETAHARGIPMISAMGTGNKLDAQQLRIADLSKTQGCPLARIVRKELKARGIIHHPVVFSPELPHRAHDGSETPPPGRRSIPASSMWVPASAGLLLAQWVISLLADVPTHP
ncbi:tRNA threonylcarbamoyladenosine dehydratase [Pseudoflavonifractor capillosus]|uniref:tRNA threonylcarbamoyladenosine dehydratase n=1 Tax=Pseudoflavonifractor capillosus TaxID=106588 RepID=UPI00195BEC7A|nr:tRNA threonylcarbamoyladenosine dehydratase [Pseudoflavonifractor capillosus]MBM6897823.1 tRNA threonylcarbamoyladenosine dehydratase [Pseudoflavonifractor capillosus]